MHSGLDRWIEELFPGLGFFGGTENFALNLGVNAEMDRLVIWVDAGRPEFLNIGAIKLYDSTGAQIDLRSVVSRVALSTIYGQTSEQDVAERLLTGRMLHSELEKTPTLTVEFSWPVAVSRLSVLNRPDKFGQRSRFLNVRGFTAKTPLFHHVNSSVDRVQSLFYKALFDASVTAECLAGLNEAAATSFILDRFMEGISSRRIAWSPRDLAQFLPLFEERPVLSDFHYRVLAEIVLQLIGDRSYLETKQLSPLHQVLWSDRVLDCLARETGALKKIRSGFDCDIVISKHRIQEAILVKERDAFIAALEQLLPVLEGYGVQAMICYGTLLGAVRENRFLPHDDDVDVLYVDGSSTREEAIENKKRLVESLKRDGYAVWDSGENFHVMVGDASVDLFPSWQENGRITVMMERYQYRDIPAELVFPPSTASLFDRSYPAPASPEGFLAERYGEGWKISDPYHEWPWTIKQVACNPEK